MPRPVLHTELARLGRQKKQRQSVWRAPPATEDYDQVGDLLRKELGILTGSACTIQPTGQGNYGRVRTVRQALSDWLENIASEHARTRGYHPSSPAPTLGNVQATKQEYERTMRAIRRHRSNPRQFPQGLVMNVTGLIIDPGKTGERRATEYAAAMLDRFAIKEAPGATLRQRNRFLAAALSLLGLKFPNPRSDRSAWSVFVQNARRLNAVVRPSGCFADTEIPLVHTSGKPVEELEARLEGRPI